jgi:hypothetical protein
MVHHAGHPAPTHHDFVAQAMVDEAHLRDVGLTAIAMSESEIQVVFGSSEGASFSSGVTW